ncbi:MAG: branched chain amino acid aminotransferase, partial [Gammaproteobacteria bacterium]|nr:branched chain amino acid aminotransferase [Gammaproteobacteria bacterium]
MNQSKKAMDWGNLGFSYIETDVRFSARWHDGDWDEGELVASSEMRVHEGSPVLHYGQAC